MNDLPETPAPTPATSVVSPRARRLAALLGMLAGALGFTALALTQGDFVAGEVGLGLHTSSAVEVGPQGRISGYLQHVSELRGRLRALQAEGHPVALWLGASQLHAINERQPGDHLAVYYADQRARARGAPLRYLQVSAPNANLQELLRVYQAFRAEPRALPETLILALTYDDLSESGVRPAAAALVAPPPAAAEPQPGAEGPGAAAAAAPAAGGASQDGSSPVRRSATAGTPQERLEDLLVGGLERVWPGYARRSSVRSWLIVSWKEPLTHLLFKLRGRPGRALDPELKAWNLEALDAFFRLTREDGVRLRIYKVPHRPGEKPFYHPRAAYDAFFVELSARCAREGVPYLDLETLVPASEWGLTNNFLPDVFHFQDSGHRLLGGAIDRWLEEQP